AVDTSRFFGLVGDTKLVPVEMTTIRADTETGALQVTINLTAAEVDSLPAFSGYGGWRGAWVPPDDPRFQSAACPPGRAADTVEGDACLQWPASRGSLCARRDRSPPT
ncbi:MAG: hypothetical protein AAFQ33_04940, partial [Pseudomonadota bacterium]